MSSHLLIPHSRGWYAWPTSSSEGNFLGLAFKNIIALFSPEAVTKAGFAYVKLFKKSKHLGDSLSVREAQKAA